MLKRQRLSKTLRIDDFRTDDELFSSSEEGSSESGFRTSFVSATDGLTVLLDDCELVVLLGVLAEEIITFGICVPSDVAKISFDSFRLVMPPLFRFDSISLFNSSSTDVELIALLTLMLAVVDVVFVVVLEVVLAKVLVIEIFECTLVLMDDVGERVVELLEVVIVVVLVLLILSVLLVVFVLLEI